MCPSNTETSLNDAVKNQNSPGDENDARTPNVPESSPASAVSSAAPSGKDSKPQEDVSTVGHSDAPKKPVDAKDAQAEIPDPSDVGEAG